MVVKGDKRKEKDIKVADEREARKFLKTGEFLRRAGISRQTLHTYLNMGLIEEADRTKTGRYLFDDKALRRVGIIQRLNTSGYPLHEIKEIYFKEGR